MESVLDPASASLVPDLLPEELWYERLLRYGLYVGGVFQLVCILAVVFVPPPRRSAATASAGGDGDDDDDLKVSDHPRSRLVKVDGLQ